MVFVCYVIVRNYVCSISFPIGGKCYLLRPYLIKNVLSCVVHFILQLSRLHALEGHHEEVKQELEKNIQSLRNQISKYDTDYNKNMEVLTGISDNLMNLLRNVRILLLCVCLSSCLLQHFRWT